MAENVEQNLALAIEALEQAISKLQFATAISETEDIEDLAPEEFLVEIMGDVHVAATAIRRMREEFLLHTSLEGEVRETEGDFYGSQEQTEDDPE